MGRLWATYLQRRRTARFRQLREQVRLNREVVAAFTAGRAPQSNAEFLAGRDGGEWGRWMLAARWAVARVSRVRPELIRDSDRFAELTALPGWSGGCAGFDTIALAALIEEAAGVCLPDREWERVPCPILHGSLRVGEFASAVAGACERVSRAGGPDAAPGTSLEGK